MLDRGETDVFKSLCGTVLAVFYLGDISAQIIHEGVQLLSSLMRLRLQRRELLFVEFMRNERNFLNSRFVGKITTGETAEKLTVASRADGTDEFIDMGAQEHILFDFKIVHQRGDKLGADLIIGWGEWLHKHSIAFSVKGAIKSD